MLNDTLAATATIAAPADSEGRKKGRKSPAKLKGIYERMHGSGVWWIRYADGGGKIRREKAGTHSMAVALYKKRGTEVLQGRKLPETLRRAVGGGEKGVQFGG